MKQGRRFNNWSNDTYELFRDAWECWACGRNTADSGHHVLGRGKSEGCESSPLNFAPLCNHRCHLPRHGFWTSREGQKFLFQKTIDYLIKIGYVLTEKDNQFLEKYADIISQLNIKL